MMEMKDGSGGCMSGDPYVTSQSGPERIVALWLLRTLINQILRFTLLDVTLIDLALINGISKCMR